MRRTYEPSPLTIPPDVTPDHPRFLETLNDRMTQIGAFQDSIRGLSGTIMFGADIDMGGHQILNAAGGGEGTGVLTQEEADRRYLRNIRAIIENELRNRMIGRGGSGGTATVYDVMLVADTNITSPISSPMEGDSLSVLILQDGTGGHSITWGTGFHSSIPSVVNGDPGKRTHYRFVAGTGSLWYLDGEPWTEL